jgi:hypothetical protein
MPMPISRDRPAEVVGGGDAGGEGQHGDEMRRPDSGPARQGGGGEPEPALPAGSEAGMVEECQAGRRGKVAHNRREQNQLEVVVFNYAIIEGIHDLLLSAGRFVAYQVHRRG